MSAPLAQLLQFRRLCYATETAMHTGHILGSLPADVERAAGDLHDDLTAALLTVADAEQGAAGARALDALRSAARLQARLDVAMHALGQMMPHTAELAETVIEHRAELMGELAEAEAAQHHAVRTLTAILTREEAAHGH